MIEYVALVRGINVGRAKAVPMAVLAEVFQQRGFERVVTVLRSGNVVAGLPGRLPAGGASALEKALLAATGVDARILLLTAERFRAIAAANPLLAVSADGSKSFITFTERMPSEPVQIPPADLGEELLVTGPDALYQWIPAGSLQSQVPRSYWKQFEFPTTTRNLNTVRKILAQLSV